MNFYRMFLKNDFFPLVPIFTLLKIFFYSHGIPFCKKFIGKKKISLHPKFSNIQIFVRDSKVQVLYGWFGCEESRCVHCSSTITKTNIYVHSTIFLPVFYQLCIYLYHNYIYGIFYYMKSENVRNKCHK